MVWAQEVVRYRAEQAEPGHDTGQRCVSLTEDWYYSVNPVRVLCVQNSKPDTKTTSSGYPGLLRAFPASAQRGAGCGQPGALRRTKGWTNLIEDTGVIGVEPGAFGGCHQRRI